MLSKFITKISADDKNFIPLSQPDHPVRTNISIKYPWLMKSEVEGNMNSSKRAQKSEFGRYSIDHDDFTVSSLHTSVNLVCHCDLTSFQQKRRGTDRTTDENDMSCL